MPYDIPNVRCENGAAANHVRIGWYRSVFNIPHAFAVCSFADELAGGRPSPLEYFAAADRRATPYDLRAWASITRITAQSSMPNPIDHRPAARRLRPGRGKQRLGASFRRDRAAACVHRSFLTYVALVAQVAVGTDGQVTIPRIDRRPIAAWWSIRTGGGPAGRAPRSWRSARFYSNITRKEGRIEQGNFDDSRWRGTDITPVPAVYLVDSTAPPAGAGEPGVPPYGAGDLQRDLRRRRKRIRSLPIIRSCCGLDQNSVVDSGATSYWR